MVAGKAPTPGLRAISRQSTDFKHPPIKVSVPEGLTFQITAEKAPLARIERPA
jgi:hypothetical protein